MKFWHLVLLAFVIWVLSGCASVHKSYVLTETEQYYFIPAGTPFNAVLVKGQPPVEVIRAKDTWAIDASYLVKLQEEANAHVLNPPK